MIKIYPKKYQPASYKFVREELKHNGSFENICIRKDTYAKILIASAPRSGSRWLANNLLTNGYEMFHEEVGEDGVVSWQHIATNEYYCKSNNVFHLMRDPLKVINSIYFTKSKSSFPFMLDCIEEKIDWNWVDRNMFLDTVLFTYVNWIKIIEKRSKQTFYLEKLQEKEEFLKLLSVFDPKVYQKTLLLSTEKVNSIEHEAMGWDTIRKKSSHLYLIEEAQEIAEENGYTYD